MIPTRLSFVTLGARDVAALRDFYAGWGWSELDGGTGEFAQFQLQGVRLALYRLDLLRDEADPGGQLPPAGWSGVVLSINVTEREDVDGVHAAAAQAGATVVSAPVDREWGGRSGYLADPEGHRWEVAWLPGWLAP